VHEIADLFNNVETFAVKLASTIVFLLWLYRHVRGEFNHRD